MDDVMTYALATIRIGGRPTPVIETDGAYYDLAIVAPELLQPEPSRGLMNLFRDWADSDRKLGDLAKGLSASGRGRLQPAPAADAFMAPLLTPNKLVLGGANYYEHMRLEVGQPNFKKEDAMPVFFLKPPSTSLVGAGKTVRYPTQSQKFDWEIELAVAVSRPLRRATEAEAAQAIAGYMVGIDLSLRDWQFNQKHPFKFDLFGGKAFDDSCPMGPKFVPARFVDPKNLQLQLSVNGVLKQNAHSSDMIWSAAEQLSELSQHLTLEPGDVLLTGTPAGVGFIKGDYMKVGDKISAEITGLGRLDVEIVPDTGRIA